MSILSSGPKLTWPDSQKISPHLTKLSIGINGVVGVGVIVCDGVYVWVGVFVGVKLGIGVFVGVGVGVWVGTQAAHPPEL